MNYINPTIGRKFYTYTFIKSIKSTSCIKYFEWIML